MVMSGLSQSTLFPVHLVFQVLGVSERLLLPEDRAVLLRADEECRKLPAADLRHGRAGDGLDFVENPVAEGAGGGGLAALAGLVERDAQRCAPLGVRGLLDAREAAPEAPVAEPGRQGAGLLDHLLRRLEGHREKMGDAV
jgi:hypothetical protein